MYRRVPVTVKRHQEQLAEVSRPPLIPLQIWKEEVRNSCNAPKKWQLIDAIGSIMGLFFWVDASRRIQKGVRNHEIDKWALGEISLATLMVYIHAPRFFYSKEEFCKEIEPTLSLNDDNRWA